MTKRKQSKTEELIDRITDEVYRETENFSDDEYLDVLEGIADRLKDSAEVRRQELNDKE